MGLELQCTSAQGKQHSDIKMYGGNQISDVVQQGAMAVVQLIFRKTILWYCEVRGKGTMLAAQLTFKKTTHLFCEEQDNMNTNKHTVMHGPPPMRQSIRKVPLPRLPI